MNYFRISDFFITFAPSFAYACMECALSLTWNNFIGANCLTQEIRIRQTDTCTFL